MNEAVVAVNGSNALVLDTAEEKSLGNEENAEYRLNADERMVPI